MTETKKKSKPKERDSLFRLKHIAYCQSQGAPGDSTLEDLIRFAKWKLCEARGYLLKDPVWAEYRDEEILVEYYALQFDRDKTLRESFEAVLAAGTEESYAETVDWMEEEKEKNLLAIENYKKEREAAEKPEEEKEPEEFDFTPNGE